MSSYLCRSRDRSGALVEKTLQAGSRHDAVQVLLAAGLTPIEVREVLQESGAPRVHSAPITDAKEKASPSRHGKITRRELMNLSIQLSSTLSAGVPILGGLEAMRARTKNKALAGILSEMVDDLQHGLSLSEAMAKHPQAFSSVYVGTIRAGEESSMLEEMLENLAEFLENEMEMRSEVRSAVMYPAIVVTTLILAIGVLIVFIVPRFAAFYEGFDAELPLATRVLIGASSLLSEQFLFVLAGAAAATFGAMRALRLPAVRARVDRIVLRIPVLGPLLEAGVTLHVAQMLGLFSRAGMPILEGLRTIAGTIGNAKYRSGLFATADGIAVGDTLAEGLERTECLPVEARQMISNGEATGSLERACLAVARHYKKELRYRAKNTTTMIEPALTVVLAAVVLFVALAAFLPMWDLVQVVGK